MKSPQSTRLGQWWRLAALLSVAALFVTACGGARTSVASDPAGSPPAGSPPAGSPAESSAPPAAAGDPITLNYAAFMAPSSPHALAFDWLSEEMNKRTNGRVTIERFYAGALCGVNEILACQQDGRADLGVWLPWRDPQKFPLASVVGVLFVTNNTVAHTVAFDRLAQENELARGEFASQGLVPLYYGPVGPAILGTKEPVESLDWLSGRSVRTTGYFADAVAAVGGSPVDLPNSETYESLQRGVIEGFYAVTLDGAAIDQKLHEVTQYWQDLGAGEYANVVTTISQRAFDKLTPAEQQILLEIVDELRDKWWEEYYFPKMAEACQIAIDGGVQYVKVWAKEKPGEVERFRTAAAEVVKNKWMEQAKAAGAPAEEFFQTYVDTIRALEAELGPQTTATERCAERFE